MNTFDNNQDVIDSRDIIERIDTLESEREDAAQPTEWDESEDGQELKVLKALAEEAEGYAADWSHGETLIRDSYFQEYAQELAKDTGAVNTDAAWPNNCIDWEKAADELKQDYTEVDFDGVAYWIR